MALRDRLSARLREMRRVRGLTQEALAEATERSVDGISQIERGVTLPALDTLERIAIALDVPIAAFFDGGPDETDDRARLQARLFALLADLSDRDLEIGVEQIGVLARLARRRGSSD